MGGSHVMDEGLFGHVHCRSCGREMRPGALICPRCDALGLGPVVAARAMAADRATAAPPPGVARTLVPPVEIHSEPVGEAEEAVTGPVGMTELSRSAVVVPRPVEYVWEPAPPEPPAPIAAAPAAVAARKAPVVRRKFRPIDIWRRYLPPVRLVWIFLGILVAVGGGFVSSTRAIPLLVLPVTALITDLAFQKVRFPRLRIPDAAIATSLFLALIIWPADVTLALLSIAVVSVGLRHFVRAGGHPWFNPAAAGLVLATAIFALPTSWHVGLSSGEIVLVALFGTLLIVRAPHAWRIPVFYFASNLVTVLAITFALGAGATWPMALEFEVFSGASVFFGFFMVTEPRTAPSARWAMAVFGGIVGVVSGAFPVLFAEVPVLGALGVIAPFLALFVGNLFTLLPFARGARRAAPSPSATAAPT